MHHQCNAAPPHTQTLNWSTFLEAAIGFMYGVSNTGTSGLAGRLPLRPGGERGASVLLTLNPGVRNTGGSGDTKFCTGDTKNRNIKRV